MCVLGHIIDFQAVQRDIFTPLFLGATLLVPSKEDIQHERLAEWFEAHLPTTTHLTPVSSNSQRQRFLDY